MVIKIKTSFIHQLICWETRTYSLKAMCDRVAHSSDRDVSPLFHEDIENGVQHVVEQHQHIGELRQRAQTWPGVLS